MAAYSLPSLCSANATGSSLYLAKGSRNSPKRLRVIKVQSFQEEGKSTSIVDANLKVLKQRMEMVKVKERLERCCRCENGWNYNKIVYEEEEEDGNIHIKKSKALISNFVDLIALICGTLGCTCLSGTLFLCLVSFLVHLQL